MAVTTGMKPITDYLNGWETTFESVTHPITGKLVVCNVRFQDSLITSLNKGQLSQEDRLHIKRQMAAQIAEFLLENNMIEFTQIRDPSTFDTVVLGRVYVTPDGQTRIIRTLKR